MAKSSHPKPENQVDVGLEGMGWHDQDFNGAGSHFHVKDGPGAPSPFGTAPKSA